MLYVILKSKKKVLIRIKILNIHFTYTPYNHNDYRYDLHF